MRKDDPTKKDTVDHYLSKPGDAVRCLNTPEGTVSFPSELAPFGVMRLKSGRHIVVRLGLVAYSRPVETMQEAQDMIGDVLDPPHTEEARSN